MRTLVMPFDDLSPEQNQAWVGQAFAETTASHLGSAGQNVVSLTELERKLEEKGITDGASVTTATVIVMGRELGATRAVVGAYRVDEELVEVTVKVIDLELGGIVGIIEDHGSVRNLLHLENQVAKNIFRLQDSVPSSFDGFAARRETIPLDAHEKYARARGSNEPAKRRELLQSALQLHPDYPEARLLLGRLALETGAPREAIETLFKIRPSEAVYREAYFLLGLAYLGVDDPSGAAEIFTNFTEQEEKAAFVNNLGVARLREDDAARASTAFERAVELEPDEPLYLFNLGWISWRAGKGSEALRWFREAVRLDPEDAEAHLFLSAAAAAQALPDESNEERELALALSPELADVDASTVEALERVANRLPPTTTLVRIPPVTTESMYEKLVQARARRAEGRLEDAIRELQRLLYMEPHLLEARMELAETYSEAGELNKAVGEFRILLWDQESSEVHLRLAETYLKMDDHQKANLHAERALELDPRSQEAHQLLERLRDF
jgi:tetratricopeptide (TPR) repeat protein